MIRLSNQNQTILGFYDKTVPFSYDLVPQEPHRTGGILPEWRNFLGQDDGFS